MEVKNMTIEQLESRKKEIVGLMDNDGANLDELEAEVREINTELEKRAADEAKRNEIRKAVASGTVQTQTVQEFRAERVAAPSNDEIRKSPEYINAFARYLQTNDPAECRSLLTTNASGYVPVPVIVDEIIRTAWDESDILSRVKKTNIKGNLKVAFELSADGAYVHTEGTTAPTEV